ncbi:MULTISPECIES: hypothetical protein [Sinorhizobium/Ensifer group]|jgi:hypothetical protein|uniref:hypothetical protein n=1 Tax=Sinorhizobium/Ensifer group TaxID=227292 RepID=UPI00071CF570|nr:MULTISPECIES: hypothetical protein [Sinorhizobium/Ensifer group]
MASQYHVQQPRRAIGTRPQFSTNRPSVKGPAFAKYRSKMARDLACILDLNSSVTSWACNPLPLVTGHGEHVPDFWMRDTDGVSWLLDAPDRKLSCNPEVLLDAALAEGRRYRLVDSSEIYDGFRLRNAKDLLRYSGHNASLGDRVRLLSALEEHGSLPFADCLRAIHETQPVAALASLILHGFVEVELDDGLIGPETMVRRIRA